MLVLRSLKKLGFIDKLKAPEMGAFCVSLFFHIFKKVAGLTFQSFAYGVHSLKAYAFHFAVFEV